MAFCYCMTLPGLVLACSGACDAGHLADQAARRLDERRVARMASLASIGARVSGVVASAEGATRLLVIDGCAQDCGRYCLEQAGLTGFLHVRVCDIGRPSAARPDGAPAVERVAAVARALLLGEPSSPPRRPGPRHAIS